MKALVYHGDHNISLEERAVPNIQKPTDVIIKMIKTTICGTDLGIYKGKNPEIADGRILGHEGVGIIEEVGESVRQFKKGDKVIISCITSCGSCEYCKKQLYSHCKDGGWILGYMIDGTQADYVRVPHADNSLFKIPDTISDEIAVLLSDILPTGHEIGVQYGNVKPGDTIAIVGAGPVGMSVLLTAQFYSPSTIIMVDMDENRLALAKELGATHTINSGVENPIDAIFKISEEGVDVAIEAVGIPQTWDVCQKIVRPGGHIANVGVHGKKVDFEIQQLWIKNLTITTGLVNTNTTPMLIKAVASNKFDLSKLITHHFDLSEIEKAYEVFLNGSTEKAMKIIIDA
ncbi:zinc-dependent alcohol dehydrogenase family protein [Chryseobacterium sp. Ch-15]|uniref:Zinc-dependent alcohol dehydrogenase family protein n=1 Tax=Chryseobacterium muglaense TaxID=2893752 RepID=A0A9Q3UXG2_9FLAO|nr:zinc-dependent alcohol dehydrogenase family protein [Chryseobacterium muglaense]MBD3903317.1 zinc-dependent alcohol dehydrogenase family protein [Chryseobacterium muglaense]MCC9036147.1 zinc-dependent alcohol dehydrogenase family protein [Chryseobacterium muglaense]MCM2553278.1 zinc-dependent alcohol dehydrogenase family protein [Chryseobacterium muglaense]